MAARAMAAPSDVAPETPIAALHCPGCASLLRRRPIADVFLAGLACEAGHRYTRERRAPALDAVERAGNLDPRYPPNVDDPEARMLFWLADSRCREHLLNPVAVLVRRIHEITVQKASAEPIPRYGFCPICGGSLDGSFETADGWSIGVSCAAGHRFRLSSSLVSVDPGAGIALHRDPDLAELRTYADVYGEKRYAGRVHADVRAYLRSFLDRS